MVTKRRDAISRIDDEIAMLTAKRSEKIKQQGASCKTPAARRADGFLSPPAGGLADACHGVTPLTLQFGRTSTVDSLRSRFGAACVQIT